MRAFIKVKGKIKEIDVEYIGKRGEVTFYKDKSDGKVYSDNYIELKEYYGG